MPKRARPKLTCRKRKLKDETPEERETRLRKSRERMRLRIQRETSVERENRLHYVKIFNQRKKQKRRRLRKEGMERFEKEFERLQKEKVEKLQKEAAAASQGQEKNMQSYVNSNRQSALQTTKNTIIKSKRFSTNYSPIKYYKCNYARPVKSSTVCRGEIKPEEILPNSSLNSALSSEKIIKTEPDDDFDINHEINTETGVNSSIIQENNCFVPNTDDATIGMHKTETCATLPTSELKSGITQFRPPEPVRSAFSKGPPLYTYSRIRQQKLTSGSVGGNQVLSTVIPAVKIEIEVDI